MSIYSGRYDSIDYSITLPFLKKPSKLDGSHAGDYGFDPLGLSEQFDIYYMQECETRHARLAMLAVVGWPLSELVGPDFMLQDGRAPSVLNGVNPISVIWIFGFRWDPGVRNLEPPKSWHKVWGHAQRRHEEHLEFRCRRRLQL